jgi:hypothetical protein
MIAQFVSGIAGLPIDSMDDAELLAKVTAMRYDNVFDVLSVRLECRDLVSRRAICEYGLTIHVQGRPRWNGQRLRHAHPGIGLLGGFCSQVSTIAGRFTWRQSRSSRHYRFRLGASRSPAKLGLARHAKTATKLLSKYCKVPSIGRHSGV